MGLCRLLADTHAVGNFLLAEVFMFPASYKQLFIIQNVCFDHGMGSGHLPIATFNRAQDFVIRYRREDRHAVGVMDNLVYSVFAHHAF